MSAARCLLRSAVSRAAGAANLAAGARTKPARSPFRLPKQTSISNRVFRLPVEASFCVESMLPYHSATASALLNSMLSVSRHSYGWTPEVLVDLDAVNNLRVMLNATISGLWMIAVCGCGASAHTLYGFQFTFLGLLRDFSPSLNMKPRRHINCTCIQSGYHA
ncbi:Protein NUCLEAR FUSION DEFECTIVE 6, chloroplastic/mitochondrial [Glycine max]|nr:Protein NUCLEAR FUSION DEFECTIVE 6, chloroplastic/mitochondrial [Glycine max]